MRITPPSNIPVFLALQNISNELHNIGLELLIITYGFNSLSFSIHQNLSHSCSLVTDITAVPSGGWLGRLAAWEIHRTQLKLQTEAFLYVRA